MTPATLAVLRSSVNRSHFLPLFIDTGTTAERIQSAVAAYRAHYGELPAKVVISVTSDDGTRVDGMTVETQPAAKAATGQWMIYAIGEVRA